MQHELTALIDSKLFSGIHPDDMAAMMACVGGSYHSYSKEQLVMAEGERADRLGIVISGSLRVERVDYLGNRSIVSYVGAGDVFGESFACSDTEFMPVDIVAAEASKVLLMDAERITHSCSNACEFHAKLIFNLLKLVSEKNLGFHKKVEITSKRTTREKLLAYLFWQAKETGKSEFTIPFDRQALADYLGVERSGLSSEIGKLAKEGVISCRKNHFELLDI